MEISFPVLKFEQIMTDEMKKRVKISSDSSVLLTVRSSNDVNSCEDKKFNVKHTLHASFTRAFIFRKDGTRWSAKLPPLSIQVLYGPLSH